MRHLGSVFLAVFATASVIQADGAAPVAGTFPYFETRTGFVPVQ